MPRPLLLPYPALALVMGLAYLLGDPERTATPSFAPAKAVAPMHVWGVLFLTGFVVLMIGLTNARLMAIALWIGGTMYVWWGACFALAALTDPRASATGWAVHGVVAAAHYTAAWRVHTNRMVTA
jgi:hypothetical protein